MFKAILSFLVLTSCFFSSNMDSYAMASDTAHAVFVNDMVEEELTAEMRMRCIFGRDSENGPGIADDVIFVLKPGEMRLIPIPGITGTDSELYVRITCLRDRYGLAKPVPEGTEYCCDRVKSGTTLRASDFKRFQVLLGS